MELKYLLDAIRTYNKNADFDIIEKAYEYAKKAHEGQKRESGDPYFIHPFETAMILTNIKADTPTICAALLHDTLEDTSLTIEKIEKEFGEDVANLIEGVTTIDKVYFKSKNEYKAENMRKILLAANKDIRVLLVKLADRVHNLATFKFVKDKKRALENAKETMEIFVPLAYKMGIGFLKDKLEDLSFSYLDPKRFNEIKDGINKIWNTSGKVVKENIDKIVRLLKENKIESKVMARYKSVYSIHKKLIRDNKKLENIYDILGIRIITKKVSDCYLTLKIIENEFKSEKGRFKDYITHPPPNNYQSIHTDVYIGNNLVEMQIRTEDMHKINEYGTASHWNYKGIKKDKKFDKKIAWLNQILEWQRKAKNAQEFVDHMKIDLFSKEIIVFTPMGDSIFLPEGSTPIDFAYAVHSHIGDQCIQAKVNGKMVPLNSALKSGDKIEVITSKKTCPSRNWLKFVKSAKAKYKIRAFLNIKKKPVVERKKQAALILEDLRKYLNLKGKKRPIKISKCCNPQKGDEIVAFYKKDKSITVHKKNCINIYALNEKNKIEMNWSDTKKPTNKLIKIHLQDKPGIISDILNMISEHNASILSIDAQTEGKEIYVEIRTNMIKDEEELKQKMGKILHIKNIEIEEI